MGVCQAPEKKNNKLNITLSAKNQEFEKKLVEKLQQDIANRGIKMEYSPINVDRDLLYMKIILEKGPDHIITLTNGTSEVTNEIIDRVSDEIMRKCS
jgi:hypothetical protein